MGKLKGPKVVRMPSHGDIVRYLADRFRRNNWYLGSASTISALARIVQKGVPHA